MKKYWTLFTNPFVRIAGMKALGWGFAGISLSTLLCKMSGYHYNGLLHYGPAANNAWWTFLGEHLIVWLVPAAVFYLGSLVLSHSRIRVSDVFGTVLFAQLPLLLINATAFLPVMQTFRKLGPTPGQQEVMELIERLDVFAFSLVGILMLFIIALMLVWMFRALQVSCNLKGFRLWGVYLSGIIAGDMLCRMIISRLSALSV